MLLDNEKVAKYSKRVANPIKLTEQTRSNLITLWSPLEVIEKMHSLSLGKEAKLVLLYMLLKCSILKEEKIPSVQDICYNLDLNKEDVKESLSTLEKDNFISKGAWNGTILQTISTSQTIEKVKKTIKMLDL